MTKKLFRWMVFTLCAAVVLSACAPARASFKNNALDPASKAAEIKMNDQHGNAFDLSAEQGKVVLVAFGFTNCPDECPLTMAHIKQALENLGDDARNVRVVLVTTDPVRDTPQALGNYLDAFDPAYIGIPGSPEELAKIYSAYGVVVEDGGETHSAETFVVDKRGNLRLTFLPDSDPADITADIQTLLNE